MKQEDSPGIAKVPEWHLGPDPVVFHVLGETPCPYLPDRWERKVLTELTGPGVRERYDLLSRAGFRRSHRFAYRPACRGCAACVPVRVDARRFEPGKSLRRVMRINSDLSVREISSDASEEHFGVFSSYVRSRHWDGEMADMSFSDYRAMVEQSELATRLVEFRTSDDRLLGVLLLDWLSDGASAVYSFFDPAEARRSLGSYMVLWLIEVARAKGLEHVYLGYWIAEAPKMAYKTRFRPIEGLKAEGWVPLA